MPTAAQTLAAMRADLKRLESERFLIDHKIQAIKSDLPYWERKAAEATSRSSGNSGPQRPRATE